MRFTGSRKCYRSLILEKKSCFGNSKKLVSKISRTDNPEVTFMKDKIVVLKIWSAL